MEEKRFGNLPEEVVEKEEVNRLRHRLILLSLKNKNKNKTKQKQNKTKATLHLLLPREKLEQQSEGTERGGSSSLSISSVRQVAQAGSQ